MAIQFFNIKSGERTKIDNPHLIAAFINSSDMHVNAGQGQDFGWRLSPEDVARIDELKADPSKLEDISRFLGKPAGDIRQVDFVKYVSHLDDMKARVASNKEQETPAFQQQYEEELAKARAANQAKMAAAPVKTDDEAAQEQTKTKKK